MDFETFEGIFWAYDGTPGLCAPPRLYNKLAQDYALQKGVSDVSGAVIRDEIQTDVIGRRVASIFDPFGHIWALVERKAEGMSLAA